MRALLVLLMLVTSFSVAADEYSAREPLRWLAAYLQIDTTNPPGNEAEAADFLAGLLDDAGIPSQKLTSPGGRTSLYARVRATAGNGRAIVLIHHMDVVPARNDWKVEPFSGRSLKGRTWGRGAIDTKGLGIAQLAAILTTRDQLKTDVIFLAVADEELGGKEGAGWLVEAHPELFEDVDGVINEGGSNRVFGGRVLWWGIEVAQKRPLWLRATAYGRGGHASGFNPRSATHQLVMALARLVERPLAFRVSPAARLFVNSLAAVEGGSMEDFAENMDARVAAGEVPGGLPLYFVDTIQVTAMETGTASNVVLPVASAAIDIRLLPDTDADALLAEIREILGPKIEVEVVLESPMSDASPVDHPLYEAIATVLEVRGDVVPTMIAGVTDSRFFRQRGIPTYGVLPFAVEPQDMKGIHARNENLREDVFLRGIETLRRILLAYE